MLDLVSWRKRNTDTALSHTDSWDEMENNRFVIRWNDETLCYMSAVQTMGNFHFGSTRVVLLIILKRQRREDEKWRVEENTSQSNNFWESNDCKTLFY